LRHLRAREEAEKFRYSTLHTKAFVGDCTSQAHGVPPSLKPDFQAGSLRSARDMAANFFWSAVHRILAELTTMISLSNHNMKHVELNGGPNDPRIKNDPKLPDTIEQAVKAIDFVLDLAVKNLTPLNSAHIDRAKRPPQV
jgi:hypothetical protein